MKQIMWVIGLAVVLVAGPTLPAAAAGGGGYRGGGGGAYYSGGARSAGGGGWHGASPQGAGAWYGGGGGAYRGGGAWYGGGGRYYGGGGGWYGGPRVYIGGGYGWWGPGYWGAPYPYYAPSPTVIQQAPTEYIQQPPAPQQEAYWYYCQNAGAYYPYVKDCPGGWMQVVPSPAPPVP